jgi:transposase
MRAYPKELRSRVVAAVEQGEQTIGDIAGVFSVGLTFVKKMLRLHRAGEDLRPRHGGGSPAVAARPRAGAAAERGGQAARRHARRIASAVGGAREPGGERAYDLSSTATAQAAP